MRLPSCFLHCVSYYSFNSRTPGGVRLISTLCAVKADGVSIHAPQEGCDLPSAGHAKDEQDVSIHAPQEGCDEEGIVVLVVGGIVSIHAPQEGCDADEEKRCNSVGVSIHAPQEGCDGHLEEHNHHRWGVSIHAPQEGCDTIIRHLDINKSWFQFTHPRRGATISYLYPYSLYQVSIHAPQEGCDSHGDHSCLKGTKFQFTHPRRGATFAVAPWLSGSRRFNSRTPGGVRLNAPYAPQIRSPIRFNSRTPGGVRPYSHSPRGRGRYVSIHAPQEGCDRTHL